MNSVVKKNRIISIPDRQNPNIEYEVELEQQAPRGVYRAQPIGASDDDEGDVVEIKREGGMAPAAPVDPEVARERAENRDLLLSDEFSKLYEFLGMLAFAMSVNVETLLRYFGKRWEQQWVRSDEILRIEAYEDERFMLFFRGVASQSVYGGTRAVFEGLPLRHQERISLRDVIESSLTRRKFAELVAASMRHGAGGSAQPGRLYMTTGGKAAGGPGGAQGYVTQVAYNVHAGYKHRQMNALDIGKCKLWFSGVHRNSATDELYYTEPQEITEWKARQQQQGASYGTFFL